MIPFVDDVCVEVTIPWALNRMRVQYTICWVSLTTVSALRLYCNPKLFDEVPVIGVKIQN